MTYTHLGRLLCVVLALAALPVSLGAQWRVSQNPIALPSLMTRADLQSIEAEALSHPTLPSSHIEPIYWRENVIPGSKDRRCVDVPQQGPVRSGDFVIWYGAPDWLRAGRVNKVAWGPSENSREMTLRVRGRLFGESASFDLTSTSLGRALDEDRSFFFPSGTTFPKAGEWVVVATSGRNWGCFVFHVTDETSIE